MPRRTGDAFKAQLEHQRRLHAAHGAEAFAGGFADDGVDLAHFFVGQAGVRLGEGHQRTFGFERAASMRLRRTIGSC